MGSNSVCNRESDEQNRTIANRESKLVITIMITDRIGRHLAQEWRSDSCLFVVFVSLICLPNRFSRCCYFFPFYTRCYLKSYFRLCFLPCYSNKNLSVPSPRLRQSRVALRDNSPGSTGLQSMVSIKREPGNQQGTKWRISQDLELQVSKI